MRNDEYLKAINTDSSEFIVSKTECVDEYNKITNYFFKDGAQIRDTQTSFGYYQILQVACTTMPKRIVEIISPDLRKGVIHKEDYLDDLDKPQIMCPSCNGYADREKLDGSITPCPDCNGTGKAYQRKKL